MVSDEALKEYLGVEHLNLFVNGMIGLMRFYEEYTNGEMILE